jgi:glycosyltransferase involved in cell wall biosynthesis
MVTDADHRTVWSAYLACDLFVMPNLPVIGDVEGFGIVALEACIAETCVVAADLEGIRDAISDGLSGILFKAGDVPSLVTTILTLLANRDKRLAIARQARANAISRFSWSRIEDEYLKIFDRVAEPRS